MTTIAKPVIFLPFANDRDDRARHLRNLAEEANSGAADARTRGHIIAFVLPVDGTYVILAGSYGASRGAYRLTLTQEAAAR